MVRLVPTRKRAPMFALAETICTRAARPRTEAGMMPSWMTSTSAEETLSTITDTYAARLGLPLEHTVRGLKMLRDVKLGRMAGKAHIPSAECISAWMVKH